MSGITLNEHTCPNCGGNLTFDTKSKTAECKSCGTVFSIEEEKDNLFELNYSESGKVQSMKVNIPNPLDVIDRISQKAAEKREEERIQAEIQEQKNKEHFRKYKYFYIAGAVLFVAFLIVMVVLENKGNEGKIAMPCASSEFVGDNYQDVEKMLKKAGFTNVKSEPKGDLIAGFLYEEGEFAEMSIDGDNSSFSSDAHFEPDAEIVIRYHSYPENESTVLPVYDFETTSEISKFETTTNTIESTLTTTAPNEEALNVENCSQLKTILNIDSTDDDAIIAFAEKYKGYKMEFDGYVDSVSPSNDSGTMYNFVIRSGDPGTYVGPMFYIRNHSMESMNVTGEKVLHDGDKVHIVLEIGFYNEMTQAFWVYPIETTLR